MESAIISSTSKKDLKLLMALAEKMGIKSRFLTKDDLEDLGIAKAITEGETGELINTNDFLKSLA